MVQTNCKATIQTIREQYDTLVNDVDAFYAPFQRIRTVLKVDVINGETVVSILEDDTEDSKYDLTSLQHGHIENDEIRKRIRDHSESMYRDIEIFKKALYQIENNYDNILLNMGIEGIQNDNLEFLNLIADTRKNLQYMKDQYVWNF